MSDTTTAPYRETLVPRTGMAPLLFEGTLLARRDGSVLLGKDQSRWHDLFVYRTKGGQYVVHVAFRTNYKGEANDDVAEILPSAADVPRYLAEHDPLARLRGWPPDPQFRIRQEALKRDLTHRYEAMVGDLLASQHETFAETID